MSSYVSICQFRMKLHFLTFPDKWAILLFPGIDREALCKIHPKTEAFDLALGKKTWQLEKNSKITACCSL